MSLPKLELPKYSCELSGIGKKVTFRPFTVKEQKILLLAKESEDVHEIIDAMAQIVELCTFGKVKADELPIFDFEELFLRIRTRSVSDISEIYYKVKDTDETVKVTVNLDEVQVQHHPDHEKKIMITDDMGIVMRYPTISDFKENEDNFILKSVDYVFDSDEVYKFSEYSPEEQQEWLDSLDMTTSIKINKFFETIPVLQHTVHAKTKDGESIPITIKGLDDFFT